jgi:mitochondrial chaperone BCS1
MGSLFQVTSIVQPLLSFKQFPMNRSNETAIEPNDSFTDVVQKPTQPTPSMSLMSTQADISSMLTSMASLPSFSALRDYMKFFVLGGAFEVLRRTYSASYSSLIERFFIRASFDSEDDVYREPLFLHNPTSSLPIIRLDDVLAIHSSPMASVSRLYSYY